MPTIMKKSYIYSQSKFRSFTDSKKLSVLVSLIEQIESEWQNEDTRTELLHNLRQCTSLLDNTNTPELLTAKTILSKLPLSLTLNRFLYLTKDIWQQYGTNLYDVHLIKSRASNYKVDPHSGSSNLPLSIILDNLRSAFNVGSIIRTGECFNLEKIYFCGYTPTPDNPKVQKTAMGTEKRIAWEHYSDTVELVATLKNSVTVIALETGDQSLPIHQSDIPFPAALVLGNEALGISDKVLSLADLTLQIPISGWKESFNVATAFGIACYEVFRQWNKK